jgi:hypothetical protein
LVITNAYGAVTSSVAQLTVVSGPPSFIVDLPISETFYIGHIMQLSVVAGGTAPFTYRWQKNGVDISDDYRTIGSTSNVLTMFYANTNDSGNYQVLVSNGSGGPTPSTLDAVTVTNAQSGVPFTGAGTGWQMQGSTPPIMGNGTLELTSNLGGTARSAFMSGKLVITSFEASFIYQDVTGINGADGVTFCIQNDSRGASALGAGGGSLGYSGINPSVALALNIYDPNTRGVRFLENGGIPGPGAGSYMPATPVLIGGNTDPVQINVNYLNGVLSASFRDTVSSATFSTNFPVDIASVVGSSSAYVGFTGADGGVASTQVISNFSMVAAAPPVSLQATHSGNSLILSWPVNTGAFLQSTPSLSPATWTGVTAPVTVVGNQIDVTITPLTGTQFYRLQVFP